MKKLLYGVLTAGIILAGAQAFAGDDPQTTPAGKDQMMKDCMSRMAAKNDGSTKDKMKEACKAEMDSSMNKDSMSQDDNTNPPKPH